MTTAAVEVAFDMTFPNRNQAGSGGYARSLLDAVGKRPDVTTTALAGPSRSGLAGTLGWLLRGAASSVAASHADLLHCPAFVTPWNVKRPIVISVLDLSTRRFPHDYPFEWRMYEARLLPAQARKAALVIAISEATRQDVISEYRVRPERVITIHPGIDSLFEHAAPAPREEAPVIVFPGAPIARKNLDVVLRALASAPRTSALGMASLEITGATAGAFPEQATRINALGLTERVRWMGQVPRDRLPSVFASAGAVVYPSLYEGFGFPPLEAMATGTPVVASNAPCLPEVLGDAALMFEPEDDVALGALLEDVLTRSDVRDRLVAAGRQRASMYTWEACAEKTAAAYRSVLGRAG
jgi:alpha-1,3-rhamnosyl/mannosyltransferase